MAVIEKVCSNVTDVKRKAEELQTELTDYMLSQRRTRFWDTAFCLTGLSPQVPNIN